MASNVITNSLEVGTQLPLDGKLYVLTLAELSTLGTGDAKAFAYYEDMVVHVIENHNNYIWRETTSPSEAGGLITSNYTYPANIITGGITYSNRVFNLFLVEVGGNQNLQETTTNGNTTTTDIIAIHPTTTARTTVADTGIIVRNASNINTAFIAGSINHGDGTPFNVLFITLPTPSGSNTITFPGNVSGTVALTSNIPVVTAGTNITIDNTNPLAPIINATGGGTTPNLQAVTDVAPPATTNAITIANQNDLFILQLSGIGATRSFIRYNGGANGSYRAGTILVVGETTSTTYTITFNPAIGLEQRLLNITTSLFEVLERVLIRHTSNQITLQQAVGNTVAFNVPAHGVNNGNYILTTPAKSGIIATLSDITSLGGTMIRANFPLNSTQVTSGTDIAVTLSPIATQFIHVYAITIKYTHNSIAFNGGNIEFRFGGVSFTTGLPLPSLTSTTITRINLSDVNFGIPLGVPVTFATTTTPSAGNGTLNVYIDYAIIDE
jgi:hypothetical protein